MTYMCGNLSAVAIGRGPRVTGANTDPAQYVFWYFLPCSGCSAIFKLSTAAARLQRTVFRQAAAPTQLFYCWAAALGNNRQQLYCGRAAPSQSELRWSHPPAVARATRTAMEWRQRNSDCA